MHALLLASAMLLHPLMSATIPPEPPPPRHPETALLRPESFRFKDPGYEKYLRRKKNKKAREAWRQ